MHLQNKCPSIALQRPLHNPPPGVLPERSPITATITHSFHKYFQHTYDYFRCYKGTVSQAESLLS